VPVQFVQSRSRDTCATLFVALLGLLWTVPAAASWSAPARPPGCSAASLGAAPLVVFPSSEPTVRSGPGALLWSAPRGCAGGRSAGAAGEVVAAALAGDAAPGEAHPLATEAAGHAPPARVHVSAEAELTALTAATGTAAGQVVAVGSSDVGGAVVEGKVGGARNNPRPLEGSAAPVSAFSGYLGDMAVASPARTRRGWAIAVREQRHYDTTLGAARLVPVGRHPVEALGVTLDFRAEALLVWASGGAIYACELPQSGRAQPVRRLAEVEAGLRILEVGALLSDDGHAIVAWRGQSTSGAPTTTLTLSISGAALAFAPPRLLERFRDPGNFVPPTGSLRLIRLSSEAVMLAWTGVRDGRYAVLASPVSLRRGVWAPVAISESASTAERGTPAIGSSSPGGESAAGGSSAREEAVLSDIAPGPDAEAVAVWRVAARLPDGAPGGPGSGASWAIDAARGHYAGRGEVSFDAPEQVAPAGTNGPPSVAIDPATGNALAAWVSLAGAPHIQYAVRDPAEFPPPAAPPASASAVLAATPSASASAISTTALACCLRLPYASIDSSAIRIGTPLAACLK
jgi:hypothetical protein